jgi:membrane-associated phospholipid phosphatase
VLLAAAVWHGHKPLGFDTSVQRAFGVPAWSQRPHQHLGDVAAALGSAPVVVAGSLALAVAVFARWGRDWAALALTGIALPVALAVDHVVKPLVARRYFGTGYRFPSGHAATVTAVVVAAWLLLRATRSATAVAAAGVGIVAIVSWGLLITRAHSPIDIVGGWLFGGTAALLVAATLDALTRATAGVQRG